MTNHLADEDELWRREAMDHTERPSVADDEDYPTALDNDTRRAK